MKNRDARPMSLHVVVDRAAQRLNEVWSERAGVPPFTLVIHDYDSLLQWTAEQYFKARSDAERNFVGEMFSRETVEVWGAAIGFKGDSLGEKFYKLGTVRLTGEIDTVAPHEPDAVETKFERWPVYNPEFPRFYGDEMARRTGAPSPYPVG